MLVLSRRSDQSVVVGGNDGRGPLVKVTVLEISGGNVKLGIEAARHVVVHRTEIWERLAGNQPRAAQGAPTASAIPSTNDGVLTGIAG